MKKETIEEAAERFYPISKGGSMWMPSAHDCNQANKQEGFIAGAKWQAERMYSEEEPDYDKIKEALVEMRKIPMTFSPDERMYSEEEVVNLIEDWTKMAEGLNLNFPSGKFNNWFEQFKKK